MEGNAATWGPHCYITQKLKINLFTKRETLTHFRRFPTIQNTEVVRVFRVLMRKNYCHKLHAELICFSYDLAPKGTLSDRKVLINIYQLLVNNSFKNISR